MEIELVELLARIGFSLYVGAAFLKWLFRELAIVLSGYSAIFTNLSKVIVIPVFVVYPQLFVTFLTGIVFPCGQNTHAASRW
jgi:hypothetical protein